MNKKTRTCSLFALRHLPVVTLILGLGAASSWLIACSGSDGGEEKSPSGNGGNPNGGSSTSGNQGGGTSSSKSSGGNTGSGGGNASGGQTGTGGGSGVALGGAQSFWKDSYSSSKLPEPSTLSSKDVTPGHDNDSTKLAPCMSCHGSAAVAKLTGGDKVILFGGTVFKRDGKTPAPNVEVGVLVGDTFRSAYSGTDGHFWVMADGTNIDWKKADVRVRNSKGELNHGNAEVNADCDLCHVDNQDGTAPVTMEP